MPKTSWSFEDLKQFLLQKIGINEPDRDLVFVNVKNGKIEKIWESESLIVDINPEDNLFAYEIIK